jgi:hypothetical protein
MRVRYLLNYQHWRSLYENLGIETENCKKKIEFTILGLDNLA